MKERNESQLTAQTYMEEKTKYRHMMRQLEEKHYSLSDQLKQKEKQVQDLKAQMEGGGRATVGLVSVLSLLHLSDIRPHTGVKHQKHQPSTQIRSVYGKPMQEFLCCSCMGRKL